MPPPDALVRTTECGTKVKGASELTPSRLRTLVSRTALSTHFPLPWPFFSTTNSRRGESPPLPPPVFKTSLQFQCDFVVYDFPKTSKLGGDPQAKKKNGRAGRHEISIVEIPFCRGQGSPFPGSLVCAGFRVWGGVVPGQTVRRPALFEFSPQWPSRNVRYFRCHASTPAPKTEERANKIAEGGGDGAKSRGALTAPARTEISSLLVTTRKGWRALQEPRSTTHAS